MVLFKSLIDQNRHVALVKGQPSPSHITDVRVHRQKLLSDVFSQCKSDSRSVFLYGLKMLQNVEHGVYVYLSQTPAYSEIPNDFDYLTKIGASELLENKNVGAPKRPWVETDPLTLGVGAQILRQLGVRKMRVHMTRPMPLRGLLGYDLEVIETIPVP